MSVLIQNGRVITAVDGLGFGFNGKLGAHVL